MGDTELSNARRQRDAARRERDAAQANEQRIRGALIRALDEWVRLSPTVEDGNTIYRSARDLLRKT